MDQSSILEAQTGLRDADMEKMMAIEEELSVANAGRDGVSDHAYSDTGVLSEQGTEQQAGIDEIDGKDL